MSLPYRRVFHRMVNEKESGGTVPTRTLGRTGERVSAIGLGGYHLGLPGVTEADSIRIIRTAIDNGITFLDNCWDYNDGKSEIRMGKALRDGYRERAFLMTKIDGRDGRLPPARSRSRSTGSGPTGSTCSSSTRLSISTIRSGSLRRVEPLRRRSRQRTRGKSGTSGSPARRAR